MNVDRRGFIGGATAAVTAGLLAPAVADAAPEVVEGESFEALRCDGLSRREWREFIGAQDLIWRKAPTKYGQAPFLGNGLLGTVVYAEGNTVRFSVQHSEVQDHRAKDGTQFGVCRLPVGNLLLTTAGTVTAIDWRLDLWNAELRGKITTDKGALEFRAYVHTARSVLSLSVTPSGDEQPTIAFTPSKAIPPRAAFNPLPEGYVFNPDPVVATDGKEQLALQALLVGGQTATAYRITTSRGVQRLVLAVAHSYPDATAQAAALKAVRTAAAIGDRVLEHSHREWWNSFYPKSFLSIPDQRLQSFYWIQLYKIASGTRAGRPVMATTGPWLESTPWAGAWWNLNMQLQYWLIHGSNHLELDAVTSTLKDNQEQLVRNVREQYRHDSAGVNRSTDRFTSNTGFLAEPSPGGGTKELGNLTWALHNVWLSYRHTMDREILADVVFPLLRRAVNYYLHFLKKGNDGKLHLDETTSPEYGNAPDCNYDLQLLRWGCRTLIDSAKVLRIADPLAPRWQEVLDQLVPYPVDENGFMVGAGVPFVVSHRHYSHMLAMYPLMTVNWEQPENRPLIEKSLLHWMSLEPAHRGYSYSGSGSMAARMFRGDEALAYFSKMFYTTKRFPVLENTMYTESGPVVETPLSGAQTIHDFVLQSWGGVIRVFPAVPSVWADVVLDRHLAEGAFEVTAKRAGGKTRFVLVASLAGEPLVLRHGIEGPVTVRTPSGRPVRYRDRGDGVLEIDLAGGHEVLVHPRGKRPDLTIKPVAISQPGKPWGLPE